MVLIEINIKLQSFGIGRAWTGIPTGLPEPVAAIGARHPAERPPWKVDRLLLMKLVS
jgi:hypothetical protein